MATITNGWYKGSVPFYDITEISISTTGSGIESWDGSAFQDGSVMCHRVGTKVNIVCDSITAVEDYAFFKFLALKRVTGLSSATTIGAFSFCYTPNLEYVDIVPGNLTSIGVSAFRMSSVEDNLDLSAVSTSIIGDKATRLKRWSASELSAVQSVTFPKSIYFKVPNPDNQNNYADIPFGTENGVMLYADNGCTALSAYHVWNCLNRGTSKEYENWLDWYNDTLNADGAFADTNTFDSQMFPNIVSKLGWSGGTKTKVNDSQQLQSIIDNLANGVPTIISINSVNYTSGTHAVVVVGCDSATHKLAIVDSSVVGTTGAVSWVAFEDIFVSGTSESDGIFEIEYNRPVLAPNSTWYTQGGTTIERSTITEIHIEDSYTPSGTVTASWDASAAKDGSVMAYIEGTKLTLAGNGSGKIVMNADSSYLFSDVNRSKYFTNLAEIHNTNLLDSSRATTFMRMIEDGFALRRFDASNWNTSNVTSLKGTFQGCTMLGELLIQPWDVQNVTEMDSFFNMYGSLINQEMKELDLSDWNVEKVTTLKSAITRLSNLTLLILTGWKTPSCTNYQKSFTQLIRLKELDLTGFDTSKATDMTHMLNEHNRLQKLTLGEKFSIDGFGKITDSAKKAVIPTPTATYITGANGTWYDVNGNAIAPTAIPDGTFGVYYATPALVEEDADKMVLVKNGSLLRAAAAIRTRNGETSGYAPAEFADAILDI